MLNHKGQSCNYSAKSSSQNKIPVNRWSLNNILQWTPCRKHSGICSISCCTVIWSRSYLVREPDCRSIRAPPGAGPGEGGQGGHRGEVPRKTERAERSWTHHGGHQRGAEQTGSAGQPLVRVQVGIAVLCCAVLYCAVLYCTVLCLSVLCCAVLYCAVLGAKSALRTSQQLCSFLSLYGV